MMVSNINVNEVPAVVRAINTKYVPDDMLTSIFSCIGPIRSAARFEGNDQLEIEFDSHEFVIKCMKLGDLLGSIQI